MTEYTLRVPSHARAVAKNLGEKYVSPVRLPRQECARKTYE